MREFRGSMKKAANRVRGLREIENPARKETWFTLKRVACTNFHFRMESNKTGI